MNRCSKHRIRNTISYRRNHTQLTYLDHLKLSLYIYYSFGVLASYVGVLLIGYDCTGLVFSTLSELAIVPSAMNVFLNNAYI